MIFALNMLRTVIGVLSNVKKKIKEKKNRISFSHRTDEKSEKAGRMGSLDIDELIEFHLIIFVTI